MNHVQLLEQERRRLIVLIDELSDTLRACRGQVSNELRARIDKHLEPARGGLALWERPKQETRRKGCGKVSKG